MEPLISVIIPLYNVENYLERCVDSVLNQTYQNLEVILVNDGSTDRSGNICENYKHKDERVKYLKQQNAGQSAARNKGIDTATGAFISFIDSDDWIEAEMFERLIKLSIENNLQIVECNSISSIEEVNGKIITNSEEFIIENKLEAIERIIDNELFAVWRRLYCKKLIQGIYFIENKVYEDVSFTMDVLLKVERLGHLHSNFYHYFVERSDSTMRSAYSLTKLNSIDIGYNLVLDTKGLNENIKRKANTFLINSFVTACFAPLPASR